MVISFFSFLLLLVYMFIEGVYRIFLGFRNRGSSVGLRYWSRMKVINVDIQITDLLTERREETRSRLFRYIIYKFIFYCSHIYLVGIIFIPWETGNSYIF